MSAPPRPRWRAVNQRRDDERIRCGGLSHLRVPACATRHLRPHGHAWGRPGGGDGSHGVSRPAGSRGGFPVSRGFYFLPFCGWMAPRGHCPGRSIANRARPHVPLLGHEAHRLGARKFLGVDEYVFRDFARNLFPGRGAYTPVRRGRRVGNSRVCSPHPEPGRRRFRRGDERLRPGCGAGAAQWTQLRNGHGDG